MYTTYVLTAQTAILQRDTGRLADCLWTCEFFQFAIKRHTVLLWHGVWRRSILTRIDDSALNSTTVHCYLKLLGLLVRIVHRSELQTIHNVSANKSVSVLRIMVCSMYWGGSDEIARKLMSISPCNPSGHLSHPPDLTFRNHTFCPHHQNKRLFPYTDTNWLLFITEMEILLRGTIWVFTVHSG